jgi:hypothetical protein
MRAFTAVTQGRPAWRCDGGQLDLSSLHGPGFASAATPHWDSLQPIR